MTLAPSVIVVLEASSNTVCPAFRWGHLACSQMLPWLCGIRTQWVRACRATSSVATRGGRFRDRKTPLSFSGSSNGPIPYGRLNRLCLPNPWGGRVDPAEHNPVGRNCRLWGNFARVVFLARLPPSTSLSPSGLTCFNPQDDAATRRKRALFHSESTLVMVTGRGFAICWDSGRKGVLG